MKRILSALSLAAGLAAAPLASAPADEAPIKFGTALDFTAVYTFVSSEYSQGQRDYVSLINARGGIAGHPVEIIVTDTGNQPQRGIEAYERFKSEGVVLVDFLSTPVSRAIVPRALADGVDLITPFHGRSDAADGTVFPYVFPMTPAYWSQATIIVKYIEDQEKGDLKGKKIALVGIDSPFGKEPLPVFETLASQLGYEFQFFPYPSPGNEQSSVWSQVRRYKPDWTVLWGAGVGQPTAVGEAIRNGFKMDRVLSVVWLSETDMRVVGADKAKGILRFEGVAYGKEQPLIQAIQAEVIDKGKGAGPAETVGSSYYNIGVASMALALEGARLALEKDPNAPLTSASLKAGIESIQGFNAEGLLPAVTITPEDHQGGGQGRISQWDGEKWVAQTDWYAAYQDIVWELIRKSAESFKTNGQ